MTTTTTTRRTDEHGNPIDAPAEAIELYDRAIDRFLRFHPDVVTLATTLAEEHGEVAMASALVAYLQLSSTEGADVEVARAAWRTMAGIPLGERELAHHDAIGAWTRGDWHGAARILDELLERWPADLLALMAGHQLDFFVGDATNLRDRPGRSLSAVDPTHPHAGFVRGMQAFGLEESGHHEAAEEAGLAALATNPDDVWALHAVTHTYEMRGRVDTGIELLTSREPDWGSGNLFAVHLWWHLALFRLEHGDLDAALGIYDREVHHESSDAIALQMIDASALLWRFLLDGLDTGDRFAPLAEAWTPVSASAPWYVFNDLHATMAFVGAGRMADAEELVERVTRYVEVAGAAGPTGSNVAMSVEVGLPASRAVVAFGQQRWDDVIAELHPIRRQMHLFGGSHAQRDVLERTLLEASMRAGRTDLARALVSERLAVRPTSTYAKAQQARLTR